MILLNCFLIFNCILLLQIEIESRMSDPKMKRPMVHEAQEPNVASIHQLDENVISRKYRTKNNVFGRETLQDIRNKCVTAKL